MATNTLPRDQNGHPIQALRLTTDVVKGTISPSSVALLIPLSPDGAVPDVVRLAAKGDCYIKFGTSGVVATANDSLFPAGAEHVGVPVGATHCAFIQEGAAVGAFTLTRLG